LPTDIADSAWPVQYVIEATTEPTEFKFPVWQRTLALRNVGMNAVWFSFDKEHWFHVPSGTGWDERVVDKSFWHRTQTGRSFFEVVGTKLDIWSGDLDNRISR
jgi:hypothetical protein